MGSHPFSLRGLARGHLAGAVGFVAVVLLLATAAILFLRSEEHEAAAARFKTQQLHAKLHAHSALEWEAIASGSISEETREEQEALDRTIRALAAAVASDHEVPQRDLLAREVGSYLRATEREFEFLARGDVDGAREVDEQFVDPLFESLNERAESTDRRLEQTVADAGRRADLGSVGVALISLVVLLVGGMRLLRLESAAAREAGTVAASAHYEEQLRQAQKMEAVGLLAGGIAHDFNNLLTVVSGYGEVVAAELGPEHACHGDIAQVISAAERASKLTRQLLAVGGRHPLSPVEVELGAVCENLLPLLEGAVGRNVEVQSHVAERVSVYADPGQLEQVLLNLVTNAKDAMPAGGRIEISVGTRVLETKLDLGDRRLESGRYAELVVRDNGTGIDAETLQRIFNPYFTTKGEKGSGLGLSSAWGIVSQSGGFIDVESTPKVGSAFHVCLPALAPASEHTQATEIPAAA